MKTLVLLSALVLLAFQVQAGPIQDAKKETKTEEKPADVDKDVSVSFEGLESSALQDFGSRIRPGCICRESCQRFEYYIGSCNAGKYDLCCKLFESLGTR